MLSLLFVISLAMADTPKELPLVTVDTLPVSFQAIQEELKYPAEVVPLIHGKMTSEVPGLVTRILRPLGTRVKKGEVIFFVKNTQVGLNFREHAVKAPVTGVVSSLELYVGQLVTPGTPLGEVTDLRKLKLVVEAPAFDLDLLHLGYKANFYIGKTAIPAKVTALSPIVNPLTGTARMELHPTEANSQLRTGVIGRVVVYLPEKQIVLVPPKALESLGGKNYVRTLTAENKVKFNWVKTGPLLGGQQAILSGLQAGETIIVSTSDFVKEGESVEKEKK